MIVDERIVDYIHSLETRNSDILETIEQEALKERVPIIRKEMQSFLKVLLLLKRPKRILEIGTAVAFSAILMSEYTEEDCIIDTIENYEKRIQKAKENIRCAGKEGRIHLLYLALYRALRSGCRSAAPDICFWLMSFCT